MHHCEVCGQRVRIYSGKEGTGSYDPVAEEEVAALKAELTVARERLGPAGYRIIQEVVKLREALATIALGPMPKGLNALGMAKIAKEVLGRE